MKTRKTKRVTIPEGPKDITLGQFQRFYQVKDVDEETATREILKIFCDLTPDEVEAIELKDRERLVYELTKALTKEPGGLQMRIKVDGVDFGFIPDLDSMTFDEFASLDKYSRDPKDWHKMLSILYRPVTLKTPGDRYDIEEFQGTKKYSEKMKSVSMEIVSSSVLFFCDLGIECLGSILKSLRDQPEKQRNTTSEWAKNMAGMARLSPSLTVYLRNWKRWQNAMFIHPCISSLIDRMMKGESDTTRNKKDHDEIALRLN